LGEPLVSHYDSKKSSRRCKLGFQQRDHDGIPETIQRVGRPGYGIDLQEVLSFHELGLISGIGNGRRRTRHTHLLAVFLIFLFAHASFFDLVVVDRNDPFVFNRDFYDMFVIIGIIGGFTDIFSILAALSINRC